jgi:MFS family permease
LGALVFTPFAGRQCDYRNPFVVLLLSTLIAYPMIILISMPHPIWILCLYLFLLGGAYYGSGPAMTIIIARMGAHLGKGEVFGYFTALIAVAFSFSPLVFGMLADRTGLRMSMRIFSFPLLFSGIVLLVLFAITRSDYARSTFVNFFNRKDRRNTMKMNTEENRKV